MVEIRNYMLANRFILTCFTLVLLFFFLFGNIGLTRAEEGLDFQAHYSETNSIKVELIDRYDSGSGEGGAEIVAYDKTSRRVYITNGAEKAIDIVDLSGLSNSKKIQLVKRIQISDLNLEGFTPKDVTSVAVQSRGNYIAIAVSADPETEKGRVVLLDKDGNFVKSFEVGHLPDMLTFTSDGKKILVANEGEPSDDYKIDPPGSVSIIDIENNSVTDVGFSDLDGKIDSEVRIFGGKKPTAEKDLEPEYIAVSNDGKKAYVVLQENNALAELDIENAEIVYVYSFGFKDHSIADNELDASNKDDAINIRNWPVLGMYQPDGIDIVTIDGKTYILTANEGDARDYDGFSEEKRIGKIKDNISLNADNYQGYTQEQIDQLVSEGLFDDENLGRLKITTELGKNSDGKYESLYSYGARSFSIWSVEGEELKQVFDSGSDFEEITAGAIPDYFNHNKNEKDARSDDKGPEPEDVVVGTVGDKKYAFVGLERMGGIMVYDITEPQNASFEVYFTSHNFDNAADGDWSPEGLKFVPADESPTGKALLLAAHEMSGTVAVYQISLFKPNITIIHTGDIHGHLEPFKPRGAEHEVGGISRIATEINIIKNKRNVILLDAGDTIHGTNLANLNKGKSVIEVMNEIGYDAMVLGNHDFNYGLEVLESRVKQANFDVLAANVRYKDGKEIPFLKPYTIIKSGDLDIGVIGLVTTDTPITTHPDNVAELEFLDPVTVTKDIVAKIKEQVDMIVLLAHMDFEDEQKILDAVPEIAVSISGHTHKVRFEEKEDGTILLAGGEYGKILGQLDVELKTGEITKYRQGFIDITPAIDKCAAVEEILAPYRENLDEILAEKIGETAVVLDGERVNVRSKETNLGNLIADVLREKTSADIALQNGGGIRASINIGPVTRGEVYEVLPFDNYIVALQLTGQQIWQALENGVAKYPELKGQFLQVSGIKFTFDPNKSPGNRIVSVTVGGEPLNLTKTYKVATNCFMAAGGDGYTMLKEAKEANGMLDTGEFMRDAVVEYINENSPVAPQVEGRIVTGKASDVTFKDIENHWAQKDIDRMAAVGIIAGVGDNRFKPNRQVTRAEFTALMVRVLNLTEDADAANFKDVAKDAWYAGAIGAAAKAGLAAGFEDNTFKPNEVITREQMATMIIRMLGRANDKPKAVDADTVLVRFKDAKEISEWAREVVAQAVNEGIMAGRSEAEFEPKGTTTRAETVVVFNRIYDKF